MADTLVSLVHCVSQGYYSEFLDSQSLFYISLKTVEVDYDVLSPRFVSSSWSSSKYIWTLGETIQLGGGISSSNVENSRKYWEILTFLMEWVSVCHRE